MFNNKQFFLTGLFFTFFQLVSADKTNAQSCNSHLVVDYYGSNAADQDIINIFSTATASNSTYEDGPTSGFGQILGGQRDVSWTFSRVNTSLSWGSNSISFLNGTFEIGTGANVIPNTVTITYDGIDYNNNSTLVDNGLAPMDITKYESLTTTLSYLEGMDNGRSFSITYRVYSSSTAISDGIYSIAGPTAKIDTKTLLYFPVTSFQKSTIPQAATAADLTHITAIQVIIKTDQSSLDYRLERGLYFYCGGFYPLPVTYGYFKGQSVNSNNQLNWQTYDEKNNKGFEVQRKDKDGKFITIGFVEAKSTGDQSGVKNDYTFLDRTALSGTSYYRLKQIDVSGVVDYSQTVAVKNEGQTGMSFQVFPNPLKGDNATILLAGNKGRISFTLADLSGHVVRKWEKGSYTQLAMGNLNKGVYVLRATDETGTQTAFQKLTIQ